MMNYINYNFINSCSLEYISFSILNRVIWDGLSIMTLILKKHFQYPRECRLDWKDSISKLVSGRILDNLFNMIIPMLILNKNEPQTLWYSLNLFIDSTLGTLIIFICHYLLFQLNNYNSRKILNSPIISYHKSSSFENIRIYLVSLVFQKLITFSILYNNRFLIMNVSYQIYIPQNLEILIKPQIILGICLWVSFTIQLWVIDGFIINNFYYNNQASSKVRDLDSSEKIIYTQNDDNKMNINEYSNQSRILTNLELPNNDESDSETNITI